MPAAAPALSAGPQEHGARDSQKQKFLTQKKTDAFIKTCLDHVQIIMKIAILLLDMLCICMCLHGCGAAAWVKALGSPKVDAEFLPHISTLFVESKSLSEPRASWSQPLYLASFPCGAPVLHLCHSNAGITSSHRACLTFTLVLEILVLSLEGKHFSHSAIYFPSSGRDI